MKMQTAHEFFIHEMSDMLDAEQKLVEILGTQAEESNNPQAQKAFQQHQRQTEKQVQRIQKAFESIGEEPKSDAECAGIKGLKEEHDTFQEEDPSPDLIDVFNIGAAVKVERYEISAYESLIQLARQMKHRQAVKLLTQNLKEEQQTLRKMEQLSKKIKPERIGHEIETGRGRRGSRSSGSRRRAA
jgi:ferritin-like metal-binding protein YciE